MWNAPNSTLSFYRCRFSNTLFKKCILVCSYSINWNIPILAVIYLIKKNRVIEFLGVNSLVIFAFQEPVYRAIIFIVSKLTHIEIESIRLSFLLCIVTSILTIITILPAIHIWNKKIMPIIKKYKKITYHHYYPCIGEKRVLLNSQETSTPLTNRP